MRADEARAANRIFTVRLRESAIKATNIERDGAQRSPLRSNTHDSRTNRRKAAPGF
ncbi:hypothetical protein PANT111_210202 [Pantoea brenneri]|uniref:Uncharacterized protein n=1 Tax=Pantoea brenneri TaxID=472694 RepID=A0AAX3J8L1_9GAMM|nr:hypothetical protein PANT111_210202 [Pantoea brenneri]